MNLSKSKYTKFCQCPKILWLDTYKRELAVQDPSVQARFQAGHEVGELAQGLFGEYVETIAHKADGSLDIPQMLATTKKLIADGVENICEAAYFALQKLEGEKQEKLRQALLAYCKLDTFAMVMLWQRLKESILI